MRPDPHPRSLLQDPVADLPLQRPDPRHRSLLQDPVADLARCNGQIHVTYRQVFTATGQIRVTDRTGDHVT